MKERESYDSTWYHPSSSILDRPQPILQHDLEKWRCMITDICRQSLLVSMRLSSDATWSKNSTKARSILNGYLDLSTPDSLGTNEGIYSSLSI